MVDAHTILLIEEKYQIYHEEPSSDELEEQQFDQEQLKKTNNTSNKNGETEVVGFIDKFKGNTKKIECCICLHPQRASMQMTSCGHKTCRMCLFKYIATCIYQKKELRCPECTKIVREGEPSIYRDTVTRKAIDAYTIICKNENKGCKWTGPRGQKMQHYKFECLEEEMKCDLSCGATFRRGDLKSHKQEKCPNRTVACHHCSSLFPLDVLYRHEAYCPKRLVDCPACPEKNVTFEDIVIHQENDCPGLDIACPFRSVGCNFVGRRDDLDYHIFKMRITHTRRAMERLRRVETSEAAIGTLGLRLAQQLHESDPRHTMNDTHEFGTLVWHITDLQSKLLDAQYNKKNEIVSEQFVDAPGGYVFVAMIRFDGSPGENSTQGEMEYVSLYLRTTKGPNDDRLSWPFEGMIQFVIVDQSESQPPRKHIKKEFKSNNESDAFSRWDISLGKYTYGIKQLVSIANLRNANDDGRGRFIKDDTLVVRITVRKNNSTIPFAKS